MSIFERTIIIIKQTFTNVLERKFSIYKCYFHEMSDDGTRLLFKLCSRTMNLMRNCISIEVEKISVNLCGEDCDSVDHFLWSCPACLPCIF